MIHERGYSGTVSALRMTRCVLLCHSARMQVVALPALAAFSALPDNAKLAGNQG